MTGEVVIVAVDPGDADAQACLEAYFAELRERFEEGFDPDESAAPTLDGFAPPEGLFLVVYVDGDARGCGGFKRLDGDTAYLKRMWVDPEARGIGLGKRLLVTLEERARDAGFQKVCLDTHRSLTEARTLYERNGYRSCEPLAEEAYADHWFIKNLRS